MSNIAGVLLPAASSNSLYVLNLKSLYTLLSICDFIFSISLYGVVTVIGNVISAFLDAFANCINICLNIDVDVSNVVLSNNVYVLSICGVSGGGGGVNVNMSKFPIL